MKTKSTIYHEKWAKANPEKIKAYLKRYWSVYYAINKERETARKKIWYEKNRERILSRDKKRRLVARDKRDVEALTDIPIRA